MLSVPRRAIDNKFLSSIEGFRGKSLVTFLIFRSTKRKKNIQKPHQLASAFTKFASKFSISILYTFLLTLHSNVIRPFFIYFLSMCVFIESGNIHKLGRLVSHELWTVIDKDGKSKERYLFLFKSRILICKIRRISEDRSVFVIKNIAKVFYCIVFVSLMPILISFWLTIFS